MEGLRLRWPMQPLRLAAAARRLRRQHPLSADVALKADGGPALRAHRLVLIAFSDYFEEMLGDVGSGEQLVMLPGVKRCHLLLLLEYMYEGSVDIPVEDVPEVMQLGQLLKVQMLGLTPGITTSGSPVQWLAAERIPSASQESEECIGVEIVEQVTVTRGEEGRGGGSAPICLSPPQRPPRLNAPRPGQRQKHSRKTPEVITVEASDSDRFPLQTLSPTPTPTPSPPLLRCSESTVPSKTSSNLSLRRVNNGATRPNKRRRSDPVTCLSSSACSSRSLAPKSNSQTDPSVPSQSSDAQHPLSSTSATVVSPSSAPLPNSFLPPAAPSGNSFSPPPPSSVNSSSSTAEPSMNSSLPSAARIMNSMSPSTDAVSVNPSSSTVAPSVNTLPSSAALPMNCSSPSAECHRNPMSPCASSTVNSFSPSSAYLDNSFSPGSGSSVSKSSPHCSRSSSPHQTLSPLVLCSMYPCTQGESVTNGCCSPAGMPSCCRSVPVVWGLNTEKEAGQPAKESNGEDAELPATAGDVSSGADRLCANLEAWDSHEREAVAGGALREFQVSRMQLFTAAKRTRSEASKCAGAEGRKSVTWAPSVVSLGSSEQEPVAGKGPLPAQESLPAEEPLSVNESPAAKGTPAAEGTPAAQESEKMPLGRILHACWRSGARSSAGLRLHQLLQGAPHLLSQRKNYKSRGKGRGRGRGRSRGRGRGRGCGGVAGETVGHSTGAATRTGACPLRTLRQGRPLRHPLPPRECAPRAPNDWLPLRRRRTLLPGGGVPERSVGRGRQRGRGRGQPQQQPQQTQQRQQQ